MCDLALRPEKYVLTNSMILSRISREYYVGHHDPQRRPATGERAASKSAAATA
jgi:hypothetical protein